MMTTHTAASMKKSASFFNATVVSSAIAAAFELGLLEEIRRNDSLSIVAFCEKHDLHLDSVRAILLALQTQRVVKLNTDREWVTGDELLEQIFADKGYFEWLIGGYGFMLQNLANMAKNKERTGNFSNRCGKRIASAGRDYGTHYVDRFFQECIENANYSVVADLGCGSADRLIQMATTNPELTAVGIEVNHEAVGLARSEIKSASLQKRIQIVEGDIRKLSPNESYEDVQLVFSFFMGHDLWPRQQCLVALQSIRKVFPNANRFLLCDTVRSQALNEPDIPIFTLGFEFTHMVMNDYVPTFDEWMKLFKDSNWECAESHPIGIPHSFIFDLRVK